MLKLAIVYAALLATLISASAYPAEADNAAQSSQDSVRHEPPEPVTVTQPIEPPADSAANAAAGVDNKRQEEKGVDSFQARLKRCESVASPIERKECVVKANREHGQMYRRRESKTATTSIGLG